MPRTERIRRALAILALAMTLALAGPAVALAAPVTVSSYEVRSIVTQDGTRGLIVVVQLPDGATLPATVKVPVPKGAQVQWVGEILGGDPSADRSATYRTESGTKQDVLTFTLKRSRRGQAEVVPPPVSQDAAGTGVAVDLTAPMAASSAAVVVEVPSGAKVDKVTGGLARSSGGSGGLDLYARTVTPITVGTRLAGSLRYTGGNTAASGGGTSASPQGSAPPAAPVQQAPAPSSPVPPPQAFLVLTAIIALTFIALKRVAPAPAETPHAHHHQTRRHASGGAE